MKINTTEVAELANVKVQTVDYWRKTNKIIGEFIGKTYYFEKNAVEEYIKNRKNIQDSKIIKKKSHEDNGIVCLYCNTTTHYTNYKVFCSNHLHKLHTMSSKEYFDSYLLKEKTDRFCYICDKEKNFKSITKGYITCCSDNACCQKYPNVLKKSQTTKFEKYGNSYFTNLEKSKITSFERYGEQHFTNREKFKETWAAKPQHEIDDARKNAIDSKNKKYEESIRIHLSNFNCTLVQHRSEEVDINCSVCGSDSTLNTKLIYNRCIARNITPCLVCHPLLSNISNDEKNIVNFLKEHYSGEIITNDRSMLNSKELDIVIPEFKLAIEFNGVYWHSDEFRDRTYHVEKTKLCKEIGYRLLHIFSDEWIHKNEIIKDKLLNIIGKTNNKVYARKCEVKIVHDVAVQKEFFNRNHIQGWTSAKINLGIYYNNILVGIMAFSNPRTNKTVEWELTRYATTQNHVVVGGASKLFSYFIKNYNPKSVISYADNTWSTGNLYDKLGFKNDGTSEPSYFYVDKNTHLRYHRFNFNKKRLKELHLINEGETEEQCMNRIGKYYKIYDCGKIRYIWKPHDNKIR